MSQKYTDEEIQDLAASYALGVLGEEDKAVFEAMLKQDGSASAHLDYFNEIMEDLTYNTEPLDEPKGLQQRFFSQIKIEKQSKEDLDHLRGFHFVRHNEGEWMEVFPGVRLKQLYEDSERKYSTVILNMDAGATLPDHVHAETEECYVIEGKVSMGGKTFAKGDYIRAEANSVHQSISTENGCVVLVMYSQENEMLPAE